LIWFVAVELLRVGAAAACVAAALRYQAGDRLHAAWLLFALNLVLLLAKDVLFGAQLNLGLHSPAARAALVVSGNAATVVAMVLLAGAWRAAGFTELVSRQKQIVMQLGCIALALASTGWALSVNLASLRHGTPGAVEHIASDLGDFITFSLIAPLALVTFALRGGTLFWPWLFIVLSKVCWMIFDVILILHSERARPWADVSRCLALALMMAAGVAQTLSARAASPSRR
jgi:hypothetical protein